MQWHMTHFKYSELILRWNIICETYLTKLRNFDALNSLIRIRIEAEKTTMRIRFNYKFPLFPPDVEILDRFLIYEIRLQGTSKTATSSRNEYYI